MIRILISSFLLFALIFNDLILLRTYATRETLFIDVMVTALALTATIVCVIKIIYEFKKL